MSFARPRASVAASLAAISLASACTHASSSSSPSPMRAPVARHADAPPRSVVAPPPVMPARYLRTLEIDPGGYSPSSTTATASDLLLGDLLFHAPRILGAKAASMGISCNTCHPNGAAHTTFFLEEISDRRGNVDLSTSFFAKAAEDGVKNAVSIPSLRGCRFTGPYGLDGRTASLSDFVQGVVAGEFDGAPLSPRELAALVRYIQELDFLPNANLDAKGDLTARASSRAVRGAKLFAEPRRGFSGLSCASCHPPTSFFRDGRAHRLGTGSPPSPHALDGGYETPTLLGLAETAPYFHDGRFATIAEVITWFDTSFALGLSPADREDLAAYVEAVGAIDRAADDRPLARRLDESFAYASLLTPDHDRKTWRLAIDALLTTLAGSTPPADVRDRASAMRARLETLRAAVEASEPPPATVRVDALRVDLSRLAADWAGASP